MSNLDATVAARRAQRIKALLDTITARTDRLLDLVEEAKAHDDHEALGYPSWPAYVAGEFADRLAQLDRAQRRDAVAALTATGMSVRAIAEVVGVGRSTVQRDQVSRDGTPADDETQGFGNRTPADRPERSTGLDGKSYPATVTPPEKPRKAPRRRPITDQYKDAAWELQKAVERLQRLHGDDRFSTYRSTLAYGQKGMLTRNAEVLQKVLADLEPQVVDGQVVDDLASVLPFVGGDLG